MQGLTLSAITVADKRCKSLTGGPQWNVKKAGHSSCSKSILRTLTMQGLILTAITATKKQTLISFNVNCRQTDGNLLQAYMTKLYFKHTF